MRRSLLVLFALLLTAARLDAQIPFGTLSARSLALGGAAVALDDGAATRLANPAAASGARFSSATFAGGTGDERGDLRGARAPGSALVGDGAWGIGAISQGVGSAYVVRWWSGTVPAAGGLLAQRSLQLKDWSASGSWDVLDRTLWVGGSVRYLTGRASAREVSASLTDLSNAWDAADDARGGAYRETRRWAWDAGALLVLGPVRVGGVLLNGNQPVFPYPDSDVPAAAAGGGIRLSRQARAGAAVTLGARLVVAADLDLTKNETLAPGLESREVGGGLEWTTGAVAIRGGARWNLEATHGDTTWTAGLGYSFSASARLDAAAVYRADKAAYGGILTFRTGL